MYGSPGVRVSSLVSPVAGIIENILKFLRIHSYRDELGRLADAVDMDRTAMNKAPPSLAHWRWRTMCDVCVWMLPAIMLLQAVWSSDVFKTCKNRKLEIAARISIKCDEWCQRFYIVFDLMSEISAVRTWGSGCDCHEEERRSGKTIDCVRRGKRLSSVVWRVGEFLKLCSRCVESPEAHHVCTLGGLTWDQQTERAFAWKHAATLADRNCDFYRHAPFSFALINTVKDLEHELDQWEKCPESRRHRVANRFFKIGAGIHWTCHHRLMILKNKQISNNAKWSRSVRGG